MAQRLVRGASLLFASALTFDFSASGARMPSGRGGGEQARPSTRAASAAPNILPLRPGNARIDLRFVYEGGGEERAR